MASFTFDVRVSWKGGAEKGAAMERIVREAFDLDDEDEAEADPKAQALSAAFNKGGIKFPDDFDHFGESTMPRTMHLYWEETRADPERGLIPVFEAFPDLQFRFQIVNDDANEYQCIIYKKGKSADRTLETFDDSDELSERLKKAEKELFKWLMPLDMDAVFPFTEALKYIPKKQWKDPGFCESAVAKNGYALEYAPENLKTRELCRIALNQTFGAVSYLPDDIREEFFSDPDFSLKAVTENGFNLISVPKEYRTAEICKAAVEHGDLDVFRHFVPEELKGGAQGAELCRIAVEKDGRSLAGVPEKLRTAELCELAIRNTRAGLYRVFPEVPEKARTPELCMLAVQCADERNMIPGQYYRDVWATLFDLIPEPCKTGAQGAELWLLAIGKAPAGDVTSLLAKTPDSAKSAELLQIAGGKNGEALEYAPEPLKTAELCRIAVENNGKSIEFAPESLKTPELCRSAVNHADRSMDEVMAHIPSACKTPELYLLSIQNGNYWAGMAMKEMPETFKSAEMCLAAVTKWGRCLEQVPSTLRTKELCDAALKENPAVAFEYVPDSLKTPEMCVSVVKDDRDALKYVPDALKTKAVVSAAFEKMNLDIGLDMEKADMRDIWNAAVEKNLALLKYTPEALKTPELCLAAVGREYGYSAFPFTPLALRTPALCFAALKTYQEIPENAPEDFTSPEFWLAVVQQEGKGYLLEFAPEAFKTPELCLAAINKAGGSMKKVMAQVPEALRTPELCLTAVNLYKYVRELLPAIPETSRTEELCLAAVKKDGWALQYAPEAVMTAEICRVAVEDIWEAIRYVPDRLKTPELCLAFIHKLCDGFDLNKERLEQIPESVKTPEFWLAAVQQDSDALEYAPEAVKTPEMCRIAVETAGGYLDYVPMAMRTPELCLAAVKKNGDALVYVPEALREQVKQAAGIAD